MGGYINIFELSAAIDLKVASNKTISKVKLCRLTMYPAQFMTTGMPTVGCPNSNPNFRWVFPTISQSISLHLSVDIHSSTLSVCLPLSFAMCHAASLRGSSPLRTSSCGSIRSNNIHNPACGSRTFGQAYAQWKIHPTHWVGRHVDPKIAEFYSFTTKSLRPKNGVKHT